MKAQSYDRTRRLTGTWLRASAAMFALLSAACPTRAAPQVPASGDTVLLELDEEQRATSRALRIQRQALAKSDRRDPRTALELAERFVTLGRTQHDERYFGYASA